MPYILFHLSAHVAEDDGAASVIRPSTFSFKQLLLQNHLFDFNQLW